jgi:UTP--glucose-1-phosphate uridylyltransferase
MPLVDAPVIQWVVEEAVDAGLEEIAIVYSTNKTQVLEHFELNTDLDQFLKKHQKASWLDGLKTLMDRIRVTAILQPEARGLGDAIACTRNWTNGEPFAVLLPDEIMLRKDAGPNCTRQLVNAFEKYRTTVIALLPMPASELHKYGVAEVGEREGPGGSAMRVLAVIEKPTGTPPSHFALPGRYVFTAEIFNSMDRVAKVQTQTEKHLTDAMGELGREGRLWGLSVDTLRFDAGDRAGWIEANAWVALNHPGSPETLKREVRRRLTLLLENRT